MNKDPLFWLIVASAFGTATAGILYKKLPAFPGKMLPAVPSFNNPAA